MHVCVVLLTLFQTRFACKRSSPIQIWKIWVADLAVIWPNERIGDWDFYEQIVLTMEVVLVLGIKIERKHNNTVIVG